MAIQDTIEAADAVVAILNTLVPTEGAITFERTFIPEYDPSVLAELVEPARGLVFPAAVDLEFASRSTDAEDHIVEVGLARLLDDEEADTVTQLQTLEEMKREIRDSDNQVLTGADGNEFQLKGIAIVLFVPASLRKRVALSVLRLTYRGFA
jgi:hypothetical protein